MCAFTLRELSIGHYPAVCALWEDSEGMMLREADTPERIESFLSHNPGLSFAAFDGERLVGVLLCGSDGRRAYLHHVAVAHSHRRLGIATALVERCTAALLARGIQKCHLFVANENHGARRFWERLGWTVRQDVRFMSRVLAGTDNV
jgi:ribosomal protein S18 acetylase RimI-like enzyme